MRHFLHPAFSMFRKKKKPRHIRAQADRGFHGLAARSMFQEEAPADGRRAQVAEASAKRG